LAESGYYYQSFSHSLVYSGQLFINGGPLMKTFYLKLKSDLEHSLFEFHLTRLQQIVLFVVLMSLLTVLTIMVLPLLVTLGPWGYLAGFVINFLSNATVMIPLPGNTALVLMVKELDPFYLGVVAGIGGTIGQLTGYWLGVQGRESLEGARMYEFAQRGMERYGGLALVLFGLMPIPPDEVVAIIGGATRYPIPKFLLYLGIGKVAMTVGLLYLASEAFQWAEPFLRWLS
jgi:membrane protein YqaA with SNARE-associated domain